MLRQTQTQAVPCCARCKCFQSCIALQLPLQQGGNIYQAVMEYYSDDFTFKNFNFGGNHDAEVTYGGP